MSRIHEALRKAEAEAAVLNGEPDFTVATAPPVAVLEECPAAFAEMPGGVAVTAAPRSWSPDAERLIFWKGDEHTVAAEQFRTLRSRLSHLRDQQPFKTLLVSSALPGEGKSFVSANLAHVLARRENSRVLLVDADLRWSRLHKVLGAAAEPGLSDFLSGSVAETAIVQNGPIRNLSFIPGGSRQQSAAELISNGKLPQLLASVSRQFDWIVVDSPALVPVSDGLLLADMCDAALLVVKSGFTPTDAAQRACHELQRKRLVGTLLNCVPEVHSKKYYYAGYYGKEQKPKNGRAEKGEEKKH